MKLFETLISKIRINIKKEDIPKTKEERTQALYSLMTRQVKVERRIDELEEDMVYKYSINTDEDYESFIEREDLDEIEPEYVRKIKEYKVIIAKRVLLEESFFNIKKGVYLGIGIDLENIDISNPKQLIYLPWKNLENHAEVFGTTRYGKTYLLALIAYQMILKGWDILLFDPKGGKKQELFSWMMEFAMASGRSEDVFFFNPAYSKQSNLGNPLFGMGNSEISSVVSLLSEGDGEKGGDEFFSSISYIVTLGTTTALEYLQMVFDPTGSQAKKLEKNEVLKYYDSMEMKGTSFESFDPDTKIATPDASKRFSLPKEDAFANTEDIDFGYNRTLITFKELAYYANHDNLKELHKNVSITPIPDKQLFSEEDYEIVKNLREEALSLLGLIASLGEFYIKISMSLTALLAKLSTGEIGKMFCSVRINPILNRVYREDKGLIAIIQTAPLKFQKTSDMVNKVFIKMFESMFGTVSVTGRGFERRIALLIDEAKIALFRGIEEIYNKAGGMGMSIISFMQSEKDRILKVGETISEIISDNTNTNIYMKVNNYASKENIVKDFGTRRVHKRNIMGTEQGARTMVLTEEQNLIATNSIDKLNKGEAFISTYGKKYLVKFPYLLPPKREITMPQIKEERSIRRVVDTEIKYEETVRAIEKEAKNIALYDMIIDTAHNLAEEAA